ncbi:MAG: SPOR domain-containing protein [Gemmatimonadota bacterium]
MGTTLLWVVLALIALIVVIRMVGDGDRSAAEDQAEESSAAQVAADQGEQTEGAPATGGPVEAATSGELVAADDPTEPRGLEAAPLARFVLNVASYETLSAAYRDAVSLRAAIPELQFLISPVEVRGDAWYRLLAGPATSAEAIVDLQNRVAAGWPEARDWLVRQSRLGYLVDEYPTLAGAEERISLLAEQDIPAHVLRYTDDAGADRFRVYAGAYANAAEAAYLGRVLQNAAPGLRDLPLVERRGYRPE